jgi:hypothetical protein
LWKLKVEKTGIKRMPNMPEDVDDEAGWLSFCAFT